MTKTLTAIIERDGEGYVALCPELDIASQGATVSEARHNLTEALELFFRVCLARRDSRAAALGGLCHQRGDHGWVS